MSDLIEKQKKESKKKIILNEFYAIYGGKTHPSYVYDKTKYKTYKSLKFGTTKARHTTEIKPIQKGYKKSYVHNRPFEGTRKDYGSEPLKGLEINPLDIDLINEIKKRPTNKTKRAKRRYK